MSFSRHLSTLIVSALNAFFGSHLPATFSDFDNQASSTVAMAVQCNVSHKRMLKPSGRQFLTPFQVPILATDRMMKAYGYIDDDRVTIVRPQAIREVEALRILRSEISKSLVPPGSFPVAFLQDLESMERKGWRRSQRGFDHFKRELWESNREAMWRILNDLPGEI